MPKFSFVATEEDKDLRLDQCLARHVAPLSRRTAKLALSIGCVFINGKRTKTASRIVRPKDSITAHLGGAFERAVAGEDEASSSLEVPRLFEDEHLVAVVKPAGMLTAPTPEGDRNNLLHLLEQTAQKRRHYIVHRLDLHTSGVLVVAKTKLCNARLSELFRRHDLIRQYDVFAWGNLDAAVTVQLPISGKPATTHFHPVTQYAGHCRLEARLETGRTHQIRRHLEHVGHPVLKDPKYGRGGAQSVPEVVVLPPRMALHAKRLCFSHPMTAAPLDLHAPLPADLQTWLDAQLLERD